MSTRPASYLVLLAATLALISACGNSARDNRQVWKQVSGAGPSARWAHAAVLDPKRQQAVIFGGFGAGNEIWIYTFATQRWIRVDSPNGPSSRASVGAVADPTRDRMVIVGGVTSTPSDEVWAFSFADHSWAQLPKGPSPRFDLGAATDGVHAWFYGGFLASGSATDELWQLDLSSDSWILLPQSQVRPSPRTNMGIGAFKASLYVTGGHDATGLTLGTWRYDFASGNWTQLSPTGTPGAGAHYASATDANCGDLLLAGGDHDDNIDVNTTDQLILQSPAFVRLPTAADFSPARRHGTLVLEPVSRELMLFGGLQDPSTVLADTWVYQLGNCP